MSFLGLCHREQHRDVWSSGTHTRTHTQTHTDTQQMSGAPTPPDFLRGWLVLKAVLRAITSLLPAPPPQLTVTVSFPPRGTNSE